MPKIAIYSSIICFLFYFITILTNCSTKDGKENNNITSQNNIALDSILTPISAIEAAFTNHDSDVVVTVKGTVTRILSDDTIGGNHQRFIIQLSNQQTILVEHNIDIAPRVTGIEVSSLVYVHGDYVWNDQGGLIHWTHHDPNGVHENGWIVLGETKYQ
jgi:hypothetical protein